MTLRDAIRSEMLTLVIEQNADLRDRLRVLAASPDRAVCRVCGCAGHYMTGRCFDCHYVEWRGCYERKEPERIVGACISVGMRALCGRQILEGC